MKHSSRGKMARPPEGSKGPSTRADTRPRVVCGDGLWQRLNPYPGGLVPFRKSKSGGGGRICVQFTKEEIERSAVPF
ncbi:hypothetical protein SLA2020_275040 [Shorea laevis]